MHPFSGGGTQLKLTPNVKTTISVSVDDSLSSNRTQEQTNSHRHVSLRRTLVVTSQLLFFRFAVCDTSCQTWTEMRMEGAADHFVVKSHARRGSEHLVSPLLRTQFFCVRAHVSPVHVIEVQHKIFSHKFIGSFFYIFFFFFSPPYSTARKG